MGVGGGLKRALARLAANGLPRGSHFLFRGLAARFTLVDRGGYGAWHLRLRDDSPGVWLEVPAPPNVSFPRTLGRVGPVRVTEVVINVEGRTTPRD